MLSKFLSCTAPQRQERFLTLPLSPSDAGGWRDRNFNQYCTNSTVLYQQSTVLHLLFPAVPFWCRGRAKPQLQPVLYEQYCYCIVLYTTCFLSSMLPSSAEGGRNPNFDQRFEFELQDPPGLLEVNIYDQDLGADDFFAKGYIEVDTVLQKLPELRPQPCGASSRWRTKGGRSTGRSSWSSSSTREGYIQYSTVTGYSDSCGKV